MGPRLGKLNFKMSKSRDKAMKSFGMDNSKEVNCRDTHNIQNDGSDCSNTSELQQHCTGIGVDGKYKSIEYGQRGDDDQGEGDNLQEGAAPTSSISSTNDNPVLGTTPSTSASSGLLSSLSKNTTVTSNSSSSSSKKRRTFKSNTTSSKRDFFGLRRSKKWPMMRLSSCTKKEQELDSPPNGSLSCVCTGYRRRNSESDSNRPQFSNASTSSSGHNHIDLSLFNPADYPIDDEDERMRRQRAKEMAEGVELSTRFGVISLRHDAYHQVHTQVDFVHCLVPDLKEITSCSFYWGKIDRYEAEKLLDGKVEGTFLLRDSAQEEYLFSVSFRRYGRSLHARIEQWNYSFSFDSHDPSVFSSPTVTGLIEHYKDPSSCMFFEPLLTTPLHRNFPFDLQHLCRSVICSKITYDDVNSLPLPKKLKVYCKEYHYKQRVRVRQLE